MHTILRDCSGLSKIVYRERSSKMDRKQLAAISPIIIRKTKEREKKTNSFGSE